MKTYRLVAARPSGMNKFMR